MFGARGPCLAPEDGGGGGAAPIANPAAPANPPPNGAAPAAPPPSAIVVDVAFTPEQQAIVDRLVGSARKEGRDAASRRVETPPTPATPPPGGNDGDGRLTLKALQEKLDASEMRTAFNEGLADAGLTLKSDKRTVMFELFKAQRPTDPAAWFTQMDALFGLKQSGTTTAVTPPAQPTPPAPQPPQGPNPPPASDKGSPAPGGVLDFEREIAENPIGASSAARQRWMAKYGEVEGNRRLMELARAQAARIKVTRPEG